MSDPQIPGDVAKDYLQRLVKLECHKYFVLKFLHFHASFNHSGRHASWKWWRETSLRPGVYVNAELGWQHMQENFNLPLRCSTRKPEGEWFAEFENRLRTSLIILLARFRQQFIAGHNGLPCLFKWIETGKHHVSNFDCTGYAGLPARTLVIDYLHPHWKNTGAYPWKKRGRAIVDYANRLLALKRGDSRPDTLWAGTQLYGKIGPAAFGLPNDTPSPLFYLEGITIVHVPSLCPTEGYLFPHDAIDVQCMMEQLVSVNIRENSVELSIYYAFAFTRPEKFVQLLPLGQQ